MKRSWSWMGFIFGFSVGMMVGVISHYTLSALNWQWWAAVLSLLILGMIFAHCRGKWAWPIALICGGVLYATISAIGHYHFENWQFWAAFLPVAITFVLYRDAEQEI